MLQTIAYGGTLGTSLFRNGIVASPYLPMQYDYDGLKPEESYGKFADAVGCSKVNGSVFDCLVGIDTIALQNASAYVSANGDYGQWAFLPVTDGEFLIKRPSEQLLAGEVNGVRILSGVRIPLNQNLHVNQAANIPPEQCQRSSQLCSTKHKHNHRLQYLHSIALSANVKFYPRSFATNLFHSSNNSRATVRNSRRQ